MECLLPYVRIFMDAIFKTLEQFSKKLFLFYITEYKTEIQRG